MLGATYNMSYHHIEKRGHHMSFENILAVMLYVCIIIIGILFGIFLMWGADALVLAVKVAFALNTILVAFTFLRTLHKQD